jgi:predicted phage replisome organizer
MTLLLNSEVFCLGSIKKYSWIKLHDDFFAQPYIKKLRGIAGGDTYVIIYLKLQLMSVKNEGLIYFEGIEDNFDEELALCIDETVDNVKMTLLFLEKHNLIELIGKNTHMLPEVVASIGTEGDSTARVRKHRAKKKQELMQLSGKTGSNVTETLRNVTGVSETLHCNTDVTGKNASTMLRNVTETQHGSNRGDGNTFPPRYGNVTEMLRNTKCDIDIDEEIEKEIEIDIVIMKDDDDDKDNAFCFKKLKEAAREQKKAELVIIIAYFKRIIGKDPTECVMKALEGYLEHADVDLLVHAFDIAAETDNRVWSYVEGILENWKTYGIFTVQDYEIHERDRKTDKSARRSGAF